MAGVRRGRAVTTEHERGNLWRVHTNTNMQKDLWHIIAKRHLKKDQPAVDDVCNMCRFGAANEGHRCPKC